MVWILLVRWCCLSFYRIPFKDGNIHFLKSFFEVSNHSAELFRFFIMTDENFKYVIIFFLPFPGKKIYINFIQFRFTFILNLCWQFNFCDFRKKGTRPKLTITFQTNLRNVCLSVIQEFYLSGIVICVLGQPKPTDFWNIN